MTEFGKTNLISFADFKHAGYNIVIYPVSTLRIAMKAVDSFLDDLKESGSQESSIGRMMTRKELYELLDYIPN
jgi:methylisocitrate lyase